MPIITQADLATNIYAEVIDEITRSDNTITERAIAAAIQEAKMYLARFDLLQLFGTDDETPSVRDEYLSSLVKDLACWHLLRLSNVSIDYSVFRTAYQDAITVLKSIMAGQVQPQGWPYVQNTGTEPVPDGDSIDWTSNPKRNNHY